MLAAQRIIHVQVAVVEALQHLMQPLVGAVVKHLCTTATGGRLGSLATAVPTQMKVHTAHSFCHCEILIKALATSQRRQRAEQANSNPVA